MDSKASQTLQQIVRDYGTGLINEERKLEGLLRDLCGECKLEIKLLLDAREQGIAESIFKRESDDITREEILRLASRLVRQAGADAAAARWSVESWAAALSKEALAPKAAVPKRASGIHIVPQPLPEPARPGLPGHMMLADAEPYKLFSDHREQVTSLAFSRDGKYLASGGRDNTVIVTDVSTGNTVVEFSGHEYWALSVHFSSDSNYLVSGGEHLHVWDISVGAEVIKRFVEGVQIIAAEFSPDGSLIAAGCSDGKVRLWELSAGHLISELDGHTDSVFNVCFSSDSLHLATAGRDAAVILWDVATGVPLKKYLEHTDWVFAVAFSRDGRYLASAGDDDVIICRDLKKIEENRMFEGHQNTILSLDFSGDGGYLISGSLDGTSRVWSLLTGEESWALRKDEAKVNKAVFSPDNSLAALALADGTCAVFRLVWIPGYAAGLYAALAKKRQAELESIRKQDEFESEEEYRFRLVKEETQVMVNYEHLFEEELKKLETEIRGKVRRSSKSVQLRIEELLKYNADFKFFEIIVDGEKKYLPMPPDEARTFKGEWASTAVRGIRRLKTDLKNYETVNLVLTHPVSKTHYDIFNSI